MSNTDLILRAEKVNNVEFELDIGGSDAKPTVRLNLLGSGPTLCFPVTLEGKIAKVKINTIDQDFSKFNKYSLEVIIGSSFFIPLNGDVKLDIPIKIKAGIIKVASTKTPQAEIVKTASTKKDMPKDKLIKTGNVVRDTQLNRLYKSLNKK